MLDPYFGVRQPFPVTDVLPGKLKERGLELVGITDRAREFLARRWRDWRSNHQVEQIVLNDELEVRRVGQSDHDYMGTVDGQWSRVQLDH